MAGSDFAEAIEGAIAASDTVLVLIGPSWLTVADNNGVRRLDDPEDFVR